MDVPHKFDNFLSRLKNLHEIRPGRWAASCPAHDHDDKPSLSVNVGTTGNLVVTCHAPHGCTAPEIMKSVGLTMADLFATDKTGFGQSKREPTPDIVYPYHYEDGTLAYETCRWNNPKRFNQRRPNPAWRPNAGEPRYKWDLQDTRLVLYKLPRLLAEMKRSPDRWVVLVEGESCCETVEGLDVLSTTHALGAGHWLPQYAEPLRGRKVAIFYDLDPYDGKLRRRAGQSWAVEAAQSLHAVGCTVRICRPPAVRDDIKADIADFIRAHPSLDVTAIKAEIFDVVRATTDYFPGWEKTTGYLAMQAAHRDVIRHNAPGDMNDAIEVVQRRLTAALNNVRLATLTGDLAEAAAWCQWLAETLQPSLTAENIRLGPTPVVIESNQISDSKYDGMIEVEPREENSAQTQDAAPALCIPAQTADTEDDDPTPV